MINPKHVLQNQKYSYLSSNYLELECEYELQGRTSVWFCQGGGDRNFPTRTVLTGGLKYCFKGTVNAKNSEKWFLTFRQGASFFQRRGL